MGFRKFAPFIAVGLLLVAIGVSMDRLKPAGEEELVAKVTSNLNREIGRMDSEADRILSHDTSDWSTLSHSFFILGSAKVLWWNKNECVPEVHAVQDDFDIRLLRWPRGIFILKKWKIDTGRFLLGVLPLQNRYKINNRYLTSGWNRSIFPTSQVMITEQADQGHPVKWQDRIIFSLQLESSALEDWRDNQWIWLIIGLGMLSVAMGLYRLVLNFHRERKFGISLLILFVASVCGRIFMLVLLPIPDIDAFDPTYFASSGYNRSIGDLLLNSVALAIPVIYLFFNYHHLALFKYVGRKRGVWRLAIGAMLLAMSYFSFLLPFLYFETISHNSSIVLDITQSIHFDKLRLLAYLSIIIGGICAFMLSHVLIRARQLVTSFSRSVDWMQLLVAVFVFYLCSLVLGRNYVITLVIASIYIVAVILLELYKTLYRTSYSTFLYVFVFIIAMATQGAWAIGRFVNEDRVSSQIRFANAFLTDRDYLGEFLLGESVQRIAADPFIQTRLGSPFLSKTAVRQKVKQIYLSAYFDRYDVSIHLFNAGGQSYDNSTDLSFAQLIQNFEMEASKTSYEGVHFLRGTSPESTKRYLAVIPVSRFGMVTGYILLDLSLKRVIPRNVFPELLLDDRFLQYFKNKDFSYATFIDATVSNSFGDFNYERDFPFDLLKNNRLYSDGVKANGFLHVGTRDEAGHITVVSSPAYSLSGFATNFSFLFTVGLNLVLVVLVIYGAVTLYYKQQLNYSARIQLYVYMAFVIPLVLVSGATLGLISRSAETQLNEDYIDKSKVIGERLAPSLDTLLNRNLAGDILNNQLIELARLANIDASLFDPHGRLLASSQPLIYEDRILSNLINREAFERIVAKYEQFFVNSERIGSLSYNSSYYGLRSPDNGQLIGILSLPFFESAYSLEKTQINVISTILNIFVVVFILFSILSFSAIRWLTFPLEFITRTLRRTTLTGSNKPLVWKSKDEIGLMVEEYNNMLENLEKSKVEISRIQKESAWREIAKQVAHEIKNPLTPMKLTLQQMERALADGTLSKERLGQSLPTLLNQVDILNEIAASFSAFARMPAPILRKIDVVSLVKQVVGLHSDYKEGTVSLISTPDQVFVLGDEQLLSRVFSNIIINALQSGEEGVKVDVSVNITTQKNRCIISFRDNGRGIEDELVDKIFLPHFSTKKTGSGIGLAVAKQGVEQNGGSIRFETNQGMGSTFYVELPIS